MRAQAISSVLNDPVDATTFKQLCQDVFSSIDAVKARAEDLEEFKECLLQPRLAVCRDIKKAEK